MARAMVHLGASITLLLMVVMASADPGPKHVKCQDRNFPDCFHVKLLCPADCLRTCVVDCTSCQPVCSMETPPIVPEPTPSLQPPPPPTAPVVTPPIPTPTPTPPPTAPVNASSPPPAKSPPSHSLTTPPPASSSPKKAHCKSKNFPHCYRQEFNCPKACPDSCEINCVTCRPVCDCNQPGAVCQDPRFVGGDGLTFYFHGKRDRDFCLVSDTNLHINAHFIGRRNPEIRRDFTWVQSLGILFGRHSLFVGAQKTATWDESTDRLTLAFDGSPISLVQEEGAQWLSTTSSPRISFKRFHDRNAVEIEVEGSFKLRAKVVPITQRDSEVHNYGLTGEDCFAHLDLRFKFYKLSGDVSGVLGQTYASNYVSRAKLGVAMPVLGGDKEFVSSGLFATDCRVARFSGAEETDSSENMEYAKVNCSSGMGGRGVVCRR